MTDPGDDIGAQIGKAKTAARVAEALTHLNDRMGGEQTEDVERYVMHNLDMDAHTLMEMIAVFAEDHDVDLASALVLFLWGVQTMKGGA